MCHALQCKKMKDWEQFVRLKMIDAARVDSADAAENVRKVWKKLIQKCTCFMSMCSFTFAFYFLMFGLGRENFVIRGQIFILVIISKCTP